MIYVHFRVNGAYYAAQDLSDLFNVFSRKDEIQDFARIWDQDISSSIEIWKKISWNVCIIWRY